MRRRTLTAYGNEQDQGKLAVLARDDNVTASTWIVNAIRNQYAVRFGDAEPKNLSKSA